MRTIIPINRVLLPLSLLEYGDYSCPRCRELQQLLTTTLPQFDGEICYTFRHFPNLNYPPAFLMALAAEAARQQDQFWAMHQALFAYTDPAPLSLQSATVLAVKLGLERRVFLNDMRDETLKQHIWADMEQARLADVRSAPNPVYGYPASARKADTGSPGTYPPTLCGPVNGIRLRNGRLRQRAGALVECRLSLIVKVTFNACSLNHE